NLRRGAGCGGEWFITANGSSPPAPSALPSSGSTSTAAPSTSGLSCYGCARPITRTAPWATTGRTSTSKRQCYPTNRCFNTTARGFEQVEVLGEVGVAERDPARLPGAGELAHAPLLQIQFGDREPVGRFAEGLEARRGFGRIGEQDAMAGRRPPSDPSAQLVEL